jgi:SAM-dependent methyltransferase
VLGTSDGPGSGVSRAGDPRASSFGPTAHRYEARRPGYPAAIVGWLLERARPRSRIADVGAGTGKLTRVLRTAGHPVVAVDPDPGMLAELRRAVPGTPSVRAGAESLPFADARLDAVVVAQAWHWMDHDRAAAEFARVVRPGGIVGLVWNVRDTADPLAEGLAALTSAIDLADTGEERELTLPGGAFGDGELLITDNPHDYSVEELVELVSTWSHVAMGPDPAGVLRGVRRLAEEHADASGRLRYRLRTRCHRFVRR